MSEMSSLSASAKEDELMNEMAHFMNMDMDISMNIRWEYEYMIRFLCFVLCVSEGLLGCY